MEELPVLAYSHKESAAIAKHAIRLQHEFKLNLRTFSTGPKWAHLILQLYYGQLKCDGEFHGSDSMSSSSPSSIAHIIANKIARAVWSIKCYPPVHFVHNFPKEKCLSKNWLTWNDHYSSQISQIVLAKIIEFGVVWQWCDRRSYFRRKRMRKPNGKCVKFIMSMTQNICTKWT